MEVSEILMLINTFGPGAITLIDGLIAKIEAKGTVSSTEWITLSAGVRLSAKDVMAGVLQKAGIDPASPQGVALLAAAS